MCRYWREVSQRSCYTMSQICSYSSSPLLYYTLHPSRIGRRMAPRGPYPQGRGACGSQEIAGQRGPAQRALDAGEHPSRPCPTQLEQVGDLPSRCEQKGDERLWLQVAYGTSDASHAKPSKRGRCARLASGASSNDASRTWMLVLPPNAQRHVIPIRAILQVGRAPTRTPMASLQGEQETRWQGMRH